MNTYYSEAYVISIKVWNGSTFSEHMVRWSDGWASQAVDDRWRHVSFWKKEEAEAALVGLVLSEATTKYASVATVMQEKDLYRAPDSRPFVCQLGDALEAGFRVEGVPVEKYWDDSYAGGPRCRCGGRMSGFACDDCGRDVS